MHPGAGHETGTLVNALIAHCGDSLSGIGGVKRPGIVHRLDKDTSGLLVVANNYAAAGFYKDAGEAADGFAALSITGVRAFSATKSNSWMPTRPIWNQYSFHPDLITDGARFNTAPQLDGTIFRRNNQGYNTTLACRAR